MNGRNSGTPPVTVDPLRPGPDRRDLSERILDAARQLVVQQGARRLSLSEVATLAGVSRPTIYRYFVSKEDLIDALENSNIGASTPRWTTPSRLQRAANDWRRQSTW